MVLSGHFRDFTTVSEPQQNQTGSRKGELDGECDATNGPMKLQSIKDDPTVVASAEGLHQDIQDQPE